MTTVEIPTNPQTLDEKLDLIIAQNTQIMAQNQHVLDHIELVKKGLEQAMQNPALKMMLGNMLPGI